MALFAHGNRPQLACCSHRDHDEASCCCGGPPGVGKTHLSVIQACFGAYFMTAHDLVHDSRPRVSRRAPKVLIVEQMGYVPLDELGATIFFQLKSARYERRSMILTSNRATATWASIFGDPMIAMARPDRKCHGEAP